MPEIEIDSPKYRVTEKVIQDLAQTFADRFARGDAVDKTSAAMTIAGVFCGPAGSRVTLVNGDRMSSSMGPDDWSRTADLNGITIDALASQIGFISRSSRPISVEAMRTFIIDHIPGARFPAMA